MPKMPRTCFKPCGFMGCRSPDKHTGMYQCPQIKCGPRHTTLTLKDVPCGTPVRVTFPAHNGIAARDYDGKVVEHRTELSDKNTVDMHIRVEYEGEEKVWHRLGDWTLKWLRPRLEMMERTRTFPQHASSPHLGCSKCRFSLSGCLKCRSDEPAARDHKVMLQLLRRVVSCIAHQRAPLASLVSGRTVHQASRRTTPGSTLAILRRQREQPQPIRALAKAAVEMRRLRRQLMASFFLTRTTKWRKRSIRRAFGSEPRRGMRLAS